MGDGVRRGRSLGWTCPVGVWGTLRGFFGTFPCLLPSPGQMDGRLAAGGLVPESWAPEWVGVQYRERGLGFFHRRFLGGGLMLGRESYGWGACG